MLQVSTKQSELGIGQWPLYRKVTDEGIDFLPFMYIKQFTFYGAKLKPVDSYLKYIDPFDGITWSFLGGLTLSLLILLYVWQKLWEHASGQLPPDDYLYQGTT